MHLNFARWSATVLAAAIVLAGCGSPKPAPKKADKEISDAKSAISSGDMAMARNDFANAIADYKRASEIVIKGKSFAKGTELTELKDLDEVARKKYNDAELKSITYVKPVAPPPPSKDPKVALVDPAEAKKKQEEEERKRKEEEKKKMVAALTTSDRNKPTKIEEEPAEVAGPKTAKPAEGDGAAEAVAEGEEATPKKKKQEGPFPDVDAKSPELQVVKLFIQGKCVIAYCQAYNKKENGKRIANITAYFKNDDNKTVITERGNTAAFPFSGFSLKAKDMIAEQPTNAILGGTHQVNGMEAFQFVVVGESDKVKEVKKVSVLVRYTDDPEVFADCALSGAPEAAAADKPKKK